MSPTIRGLGGRARRSHGKSDAIQVGGIAVPVLRSVAVQWWHRGGGEDISGASCRFSAFFLDQIKVRTVGGRKAAQVNLVTRAPAFHLLYIALRNGGPLTMERLGTPDQGADQGPDSVVGPSREEINLTLSVAYPSV